MTKIYGVFFLVLALAGFSTSALASVIPASPGAAQEDVIVVFDDDFLQQQAGR